MDANFVDAQEMSRIHPKTFEAPTADELALIRTGSIVKVCVPPERFWVIVKEVNGGKIVGEVNNYLTATDEHGLSNEDIIEFEPRHVYSIYEGGAA